LQDITLIPLADFDHSLMTHLSRAVENELKTKVFVGRIHLETARYFDPDRRQYNADALLRQVYDSRNLFMDTKVIGLLDVDLFIPILTYIFGQAFLGGEAAIASAFRLRNERYGLPHNENLFRSRLVKEVLHELGHTFGLKHCINPECVMRSSTYVEDIDQKSATFCSACRRTLPR